MPVARKKKGGQSSSAVIQLTKRANRLLTRFHLNEIDDGWLALLERREAERLMTWNEFARELNAYAA